MSKSQLILQCIGANLASTETLWAFDFLDWEKVGAISVLIGVNYLFWQNAKRDRATIAKQVEKRFEAQERAQDKRIKDKDTLIVDMQKALDRLRGE